MSDFLRGQIAMLDEVLELKNVFDRFEKLETTLKEHEKGAGK